MKLTVDEMRQLHLLRGEEHSDWSDTFLWFQSWTDLLLRDIWVRRCNFAVVGGDPVTWSIIVELLAKRGVPATVAILEPGQFQGAPLSALRDGEFRSALKKKGVALPSADASLSWFHSVALRAEQASIRILRSDACVSAVPVPSGVMLMAGDKDGQEDEGSVCLEAGTVGERGVSFFQDSARLNFAMKREFWDAFEGISKKVPDRRRYGNLLIAQKILLFSMSEGHFREVGMSSEDKITRFDFSMAPLATISKALDAWSADIVAASRVETRLDQTGETTC